jgi:hypothetical protein
MSPPRIQEEVQAGLDFAALSDDDLALMRAHSTAPSDNGTHDPEAERREIEARHAVLIPKLIGPAVNLSQMALTTYASVHDNIGRRASASWARIAERLTDHKPGEKDGPAVTPGLFVSPPRGVGTLASQQMIALDIEGAESVTTGECLQPPAIASVAATLDQLGIAGTVASTHSSKTGDLRYRVFVPLDHVFILPFDEDRQDGLIMGRRLADVLAFDLGLSDFLDRSKCGAESLFFEPRHLVGADDFESLVVGAAPYPLTRALEHTRLLFIDERMRLSAAARMRAARARLRALDPSTARTSARIEAFNAAHPIADLLAKYGYGRRGRTWKSPHQHARSVGATKIHRDADGERWTSFSDSDGASGVGHVPNIISATKCCGSAFDLFVHYEHGGNFVRAIAALTPAVEPSPETASETVMRERREQRATNNRRRRR